MWHFLTSSKYTWSRKQIPEVEWDIQEEIQPLDMRLTHAPIVLYEALACNIHEMAFVIVMAEDARSTGCVHTTVYTRPVHKGAAHADQYTSC